MGLLQSDNELRKALELTDIHELAIEDKIGYVDEQIDGIKHQLWRVRVDALLNHNLKTKTEDEKLSVAAKIREHEQNAERFAEALGLLQTLKDELEA